MGYHQAGFDVVGVDIKPQPRYPFEFIQADALQWLSAAISNGSIRGFDAIHASPPCQAHTAMKTMHNAREHVDLVPATRDLLIASGLPWAMENVVGAPMIAPITLCGTMFGLGVEDADLLRHRLFEMSNPPIFVPACQHGQRDTIGIYGGHARNRKRARTIGIYGEGARDSRRKFDKGVPDFTAVQAREAMGIDWMTLAELCQAIPPAYTRWIGERLMTVVQARKVEAAEMTLRTSLTPKQQALLTFIKAYQAENAGIAPSFEQMAAAVGIVSKSGVYRLLAGLEERGHIRRVPNRARAIEVVEAASSADIAHALALASDEQIRAELDRRLVLRIAA